jgi:hypothetical protein
MRQVPVLVFVFVLACAATAQGESPRLPPVRVETGGPIQPRIDEVTLELVGQGLPVRPVTASPHAVQIHRAAGLWIDIDGDTIVAFDRDRTHPTWQTKSTEGTRIHWLAADGGTGYLREYRVDDEGRFEGYATATGVRRLDLNGGQWLADLTLRSAEGAKGQPQQLFDFTVNDGYAVLLGVLGTGEEEFGEPVVEAYGLTCYGQDEAEPLWSKALPATGKRPHPGVFLLAAQQPNYADASSQHMGWLDDTILVCPEPVQSLYAVSPDSGTTIWELERIWEFQRGFIGPSVWQHFVWRLGIEDRDAERDSKLFEKAREKFDETFSCAVIGGPVVAGDRVFMAVARAPATAYAGYLSECVVYELSAEGEPYALAPLPQMVVGTQYVVRSNAVVWKCHNDTFVKAGGGHRDNPSFPIGPGGPDRTAHVAWLRRLAPDEPEAWLVAGAIGNPVAFTESHAITVAGGGYVLHADDKEYLFPLVALDLDRGTEQPLLLRVPFDGQVRTADTDAGNLRISGPHLLGVTGLNAAGNRLAITLGLECQSALQNQPPIGSLRPAGVGGE